MITLTPRISEKSYAQAASDNVYTFEVPVSANKITVKQEVEKQFGVSVTNVRIVVQDGKVKQTVLRGRRPIKGTRNKIKKAFVTLKKGDSIAVFGDEA